MLEKDLVYELFKDKDCESYIWCVFLEKLNSLNKDSHIQIHRPDIWMYNRSVNVVSLYWVSAILTTKVFFLAVFSGHSVPSQHCPEGLEPLSPHIGCAYADDA